jgi:pimeloyl-ACP methyl ester carboxylesterase
MLLIVPALLASMFLCGCIRVKDPGKFSLVSKLVLIGVLAVSGMFAPQQAFGARAASVPDSIYVSDVTSLKSWGYFFVGGKYEKELENVEGLKGETDSLVMRGHMYVEVYVPVEITKPYPLVFFSGNNSTGLAWMNTPDGRKGWAQYFWEQGYIVYVTDVPNRGRAGALTRKGQYLSTSSAQRSEVMFAGKDVPGATQFPGTPQMGSPAFDAFYASVAPALNDNKQMEIFAQKAGALLLDKIGPAILVSHSQAGPFSWLIADARPALVKGILNLEPKGMPFHNNPRRGSVEYAVWGLTEIPITYAPPVSDPEKELIPELFTPEDRNLLPGNLQKEPARVLVNLQDIPILVITGSASYHWNYDYLVPMYLKQAGVKNVKHLLLKDVGQTGNSHFMMGEKNNLEIARIAQSWIEETISD